MLRNLNQLRGFTLLAADGELGKVEDSYFDDQEWTIRYVVVDTSRWLGGRKVLLPPNVVEQPEWEARRFPVDLTKEQVRNSPEVDLEKPVRITINGKLAFRGKVERSLETLFESARYHRDPRMCYAAAVSLTVR